MELRKFTRIGRPVDPSYPTNLAILVGFIGAFSAITLYHITQGVELPLALSYGITAGLALFLGWAYAREIDPDHPLSAFFSAVFLLIAHLWIAPVNLGAVFLLMLASRILSQTTGEPPGTFDSLGFFGFALWQMAATHWVFGVIGAAAFLLESQLPDPAKYIRYFAGGLFAAAAAYYFVFYQGSPFGSFPPIPLAALVITTALCIPLIKKYRTAKSLGDHTNIPLYPQRVRTSQIFSLISGGLIWLADGRFESLSGTIAVFLGVAIFNFLPSRA